MDWTCEVRGIEVIVFYGPYKKGAYRFLEEPFCHVCGHADITTDTCSWHRCLYGFDRIYAAGKYFSSKRRAKDDLLSYHIWAFKKWPAYVSPLGQFANIAIENRYPELMDSDTLVPVPLHEDKIKKRGYNQALELAKFVSGKFNIPILEALSKTRDVSMRTLKWAGRSSAVKGLYILNNIGKSKVGGKRIILIDDVVTTGFNVSECSEVLKHGGAKQVNVFAVGRDVL